MSNGVSSTMSIFLLSQIAQAHVLEPGLTKALHPPIHTTVANGYPAISVHLEMLMMPEALDLLSIAAKGSCHCGPFHLYAHCPSQGVWALRLPSQSRGITPAIDCGSFDSLQPRPTSSKTVANIDEKLDIAVHSSSPSVKTGL